MLIRFLSGPKKGQTTHAPRSQETDLLLNAGIIEEVKAPVVPAVVKWSVQTGQIAQRVFITASCSREVCNRTRFEGTVAQAARLKHIHSCGGGPPVPVPDAIVKRYAKAKGQEQPVIGADEAGMYRNINTTYPREQAERHAFLTEHKL
jgi:hypothetical protein